MSRITRLRSLISSELDTGLKIAYDPQNAFLPDLELRITTLSSPWLMDHCPSCSHLFRDGDYVRICPDCGQAYHDDNFFNLKCWENHFHSKVKCHSCSYIWNKVLPDLISKPDKNEKIPSVEEWFITSMQKVWTTFGDEPVYVVRPGDKMIGNNCPSCSFQIRSGERVVKCPCGKCDTYFHADVFLQLNCWNIYNGELGKNYCPTSSSPYPDKGNKPEKTVFIRRS